MNAKAARQAMELVPADGAPRQMVPAGNSPADVMRTLLDRGVSPADLRELLAVQKEYEANEARKAYVAAMAEFKANPPEILKRKLVAFGNTKYMHATLGDVTELIVQGLAQYGFSHRWDTTQENGVVVTCILTHRLGHSESTTLRGAPDSSGQKNAIQQIASTVTYLQRYTLLAATGLATKDMDDDGKGSVETDAQRKEREKAEAVAQDFQQAIADCDAVEALESLGKQIATSKLPKDAQTSLRAIYTARLHELKGAPRAAA